ncbi:Fmu (Sun) domain protein [Metallosphaera sedula]|uniref:Fmu (Sun) domain protein n=2 Tax=Metallosphaera sedula TaxID=43687 RepID=A4YE99_METS5|nr:MULTISPECIES: RsmB/NOP family class I SAM-dependent RNA methyltransferase [Metallosphaera]ABP94751.1 Fmu (Sun) domain protein [Metallosphaera sedula DSM 5348]AIM26738.1 Fmu (Sun) domain protein [Metallosphaera sedula]AKV73694.1 Fmu (Sun) domain-containing protein [Metallosphaera sedula]AKV75934.1 Fmu (Sun) domain-containing protein [Metallosphaera sedula]AKV78185.1 Fmu (Sun) domain-containing protein [Metallosphaera sedula]
MRALKYLNSSSLESSFKRGIKEVGESVPGCFETYRNVVWALPHVKRIYPLVDPSSLEAVEIALTLGPDPFSLPKWILDRVRPLLGDEGLRNLLRRKTWVRINTLKKGLQEILDELKGKGYSFVPDRDFNYLVEWIFPQISSIPEFRQGLLIPQDKASVMVVNVLDPKPEETILEIGGAPGTKTSLIQQLTHNKSYVISVDISARRVEAQRRLLAKWGVSNVELVIADATELKVTHADKVLVDAPCSNSGTMNVDPSIPLRLTKAELLKLVRIQKMILKRAVSLGVPVVYSTCSLFPEEGEKQVEEFSRYLVKITDDPLHMGYRKSKVWMRVMRTYPHLDYSEGFFISKIEPSPS